jgi:hypothetical protein
MFDYLQILLTSIIWLSCVQVLGHHTPVQPLQVYNRHWHVIIPSESQFHLQSYPLKFVFRVPISGSAVLSPPLHFGRCHPVALSPTCVVPFIAPLGTLTLMSFQPLGMGVMIVLHHVMNQPHTPSPHFASPPNGLLGHFLMVLF